MISPVWHQSLLTVAPAFVAICLSLSEPCRRLISPIHQCMQRRVQSVQTIIEWLCAVAIVAKGLAIPVINQLLGFFFRCQCVPVQMILGKCKLFLNTMYAMTVLLGQYQFVFLLTFGFHACFLMIKFRPGHIVIPTTDQGWLSLRTPLCSAQNAQMAENHNFVHFFCFLNWLRGK